MVVIKNRQDLSGRFLKFAVTNIKFLKKIPRSIENDVIRYQLIKSSSFIGANYGSISKADFYNKIRFNFIQTS